MKTEKELKEEILKEVSKNNKKYHNFQDIKKAIQLTLQKRNAEVKQAIKKIKIEFPYPEKAKFTLTLKEFEDWFDKLKKELLQKLGLEEGNA